MSQTQRFVVTAQAQIEANTTFHDETAFKTESDFRSPIATSDSSASSFCENSCSLLEKRLACLRSSSCLFFKVSTIDFKVVISVYNA